MKKLLLSLITAVATLSAAAQTFSYEYEGTTLEYRISADSTYCSAGAKMDECGYYTYLEKSSGHVIIPETVTYDGHDYPVTTIDQRAFFKCREVTSLTLPNSIRSIGNNAFEDCPITSINLPDSLKTIGKTAFVGSNITSVFIPNSVVKIGNAAFGFCRSLTEINVEEDNEFYASENGVLFNKDFTEIITFPQGLSGEYTSPNGVTQIGYYAFYGCNGLTAVNIPNSVTTIGESAFGSCHKLTSVNIPNSVTEIATDAFCNCDGLKSLNIPNSVKEIGLWAFFICPNLAEVVYLTTSPIECTEDIFLDETYSQATLTVAEGGAEAARTTSPWCNFKNIKEAASLSDIAAPKATSTAYDLQGRRLPHPVKGLNIINGKKLLFPK